MSELDEALPTGAVATIVVYESGVEVNLRHGMSAADFAAMLRKIADAYENNTIVRRSP